MGLKHTGKQISAQDSEIHKIQGSLYNLNSMPQMWQKSHSLLHSNELCAVANLAYLTPDADHSPPTPPPIDNKLGTGLRRLEELMLNICLVPITITAKHPSDARIFVPLPPMTWEGLLRSGSAQHAHAITIQAMKPLIACTWGGPVPTALPMVHHWHPMLPSLWLTDWIWSCMLCIPLSEVFFPRP